MTPKERADDYWRSQIKCYEEFTNDFQEDQEMLAKEPDYSEKEKELEKVKKLDTAKMEKQLKKEINDWEELFAGNASLSKSAKGLSVLSEKLVKILDGSKKTMKKGLQSEEYRLTYQANLDQNKANVALNLKQTRQLEVLCKALFSKNYDLYLKHEEMLEKNKQERVELASQFQRQMNEVADEINQKREEKQAVQDENNTIRQQISKRIDEYRNIEKTYQDAVVKQQLKIKQVEQSFQKNMEAKLKKLLKQAQDEKEVHDRHNANCEDLQSQIKGYMEKFENLKEVIQGSSKQVAHCQQEIEQKKIET